MQELSALSRLGLAIILSAICCIIIQINVGETQTGRLIEQQQQHQWRKAASKEEEAEIRALIASRAQKSKGNKNGNNGSQRIIQKLQNNEQFHEQKKANKKMFDDLGADEKELEVIEEEIDQEEPDENQPIDTECPNFEVDWKIATAPKYNLRKDYFITPVFTYGPNNQLRAFRESILLAIFTNRTLILPPFYKHNRNDAGVDGKDRIAEPGMRIDVELVRQYLTTSNGVKAAKICHKSFDAVFLGGKNYCKESRLSSISNYTGMIDFVPDNEKRKMIKGTGKKDCTVKVPIYPVDEDSTNDPLHFPLNRAILRQKYNAEERCALWLFPYRTILFSALELDVPDRTHPNYKLLEEVMRATVRPEFVRTTAMNFLEHEGIKDKFIAIHWRYSRGDWFNHCKHGRRRRETRAGVACDIATILIEQPKTVAELLSRMLTEQMNKVQAIYFAAPPTEIKFIMEVRKYLRKKQIHVYTALEMIDYIEDNYSHCQTVTENKYDLLSLIEQEICSQSTMFLRASGSSWSTNVHYERVIKNKTAFDYRNMDFFREALAATATASNQSHSTL